MNKTVKSAVVYVARDIERALGMPPSEDYHIITNRSPYAETIKKQYPDFVTLIDGPTGTSLDTAELLIDPVVKSVISEIRTQCSMLDAQCSMLVFKNNSRIESIAKNNNWTLLNPSAALAEKVENKITQVEWLGELAEKYLPPHSVKPTKELKWNKEPLVLQWAHGHTGDGTIVINSANELKAIQDKFPDRPTRATAFIRGPSFTVNVVVTNDKVLMSNISYQITGLPPFTDSPFATVGNDWALTHSLLSDAELESIEKMVMDIGTKLQKDGWKGLFGVDVIRDDERDRIFLIEINARQPASTTFESTIQQSFREQGIKGLTVFEAHLKALQDESIDEQLIPINDGAQIIQRVKKTGARSKRFPKSSWGEQGALKIALEKLGYNVITYSNTEYGADLIRIQSMLGIMETHGQFNKRGEEIENIISNLQAPSSK